MRDGAYASVTKSGKQRTVPIATPLVVILRDHRTADPWKGELVFPNGAGEMFSPNAKIGEILDAALDRAKLPRINIHKLRHAMASFFVMNGGDIFTLQKILGHSTPQLVSDTYGHLSQEHLAGAADRISFPVPKKPASVIPIRQSTTPASKLENRVVKRPDSAHVPSEAPISLAREGDKR